MVFECFTPGVATLARLAGADFVMYDMEHSGLSIETLKDLVATCRGSVSHRWYVCREANTSIWRRRSTSDATAS